MNHTPGPWDLMPLKHKYYGTRVSIGGSTVEVWSNKSWKPSPREEQDPEIRDSSHFENEVDYADALLIAAAPDLLAACKLCKRVLKRLDCSRGTEEHMMLTALSAALKKAKGEA